MVPDIIGRCYCAARARELSLCVLANRARGKVLSSQAQFLIRKKKRRDKKGFCSVNQRGRTFEQETMVRYLKSSRKYVSAPAPCHKSAPSAKYADRTGLPCVTGSKAGSCSGARHRVSPAKQHANATSKSKRKCNRTRERRTPPQKSDSNAALAAMQTRLHVCVHGLIQAYWSLSRDCNCARGKDPNESKR